MTIPSIIFILFACSASETEQESQSVVEQQNSETKENSSKKEEPKKDSVAKSEELSIDIGRWRNARSMPNQDQYKDLDALGYMDGYEDAPGFSGVVRHDEKEVFDGYNFYISGHGPNAVLIDMKGKVLHEWTFPFEQAFPNEKPNKSKDNTKEYWRRGHIFPNGDILAIHTNYGVIKLNKDSKLLWSNRNSPHHHLQVMDDGTIYVLTRKLERFPEINEKKDIIEDGIDVLDTNGKLIKQVSILKALLKMKDKKVLETLAEKGDLLHTNSLEVLDGQLSKLIPEFAKGNILLSFRANNMIAVLDMKKEEIVWTKTGDWIKQHDAFVVDENTLILLNNNTGNKKSSVVMFNPKTDKVTRKFEGSKEEPFYTSSCGANQYLPNGNILITESNYGRALEINKDNQVVWEFVSSHRAGEEKKLIATLFDVDRLPVSFDVSWSKGIKK
jgi:hypothetical protein